jgi:hypothetical protein
MASFAAIPITAALSKQFRSANITMLHAMFLQVLEIHARTLQKKIHMLVGGEFKNLGETSASCYSSP